MEIETQFQSRNYSERHKKISMIVLHSTAGDMPGCLNWLCESRTGVSAHYLITKKGTVYQLVPDEWKAWHAGKSEWAGESDCNEYSIGIELENMNTGKDIYTTLQIRACVELVKELMKKYSIPRDRVVGHRDVAPERKTDPKGFDWKRFWYLTEKEERHGMGNAELVGNTGVVIGSIGSIFNLREDDTNTNR